MKYLKVWTDFSKTIELLKDGECGRLFVAMLEYAERGAEPELSGNERFIWPTVKSEIDRQREAYDHRCATNRVNAATRYESQRMAANGSESHQYKEKTKTKTEDKDTNIVLLTQNPSAKADYRAVAEAYNEICSPPLPQVKQLSDDRKRHIKTGSARLVEAGLSWRDYFSLAADSDFLMGRDGRWQGCGFDWLIGPKNMLKVLEGNYSNRLTPEQEKAMREQAELAAWMESDEL